MSDPNLQSARKARRYDRPAHSCGARDSGAQAEPRVMAALAKDFPLIQWIGQGSPFAYLN